MGRSGFSSLNDFRLIFWILFFSFSLLIWLLDRLAVLLQIASSSFSAILASLSFFQNFLIRSKKFIAKQREPDSFKRKPFRLKCLLMIFLLSTMSVFICSRWLKRKGVKAEIFSDNSYTMPILCNKAIHIMTLWFKKSTQSKNHDLPYFRQHKHYTLSMPTQEKKFGWRRSPAPSPPLETKSWQ